LDQGLPPEAVLVEMYLSEEMSYTYKKMAEVGLVKQTHFHSQTSQYGALSRGTRFLGMNIRRRMETIYQDIDSGDFAREWGGTLAKVKFRMLKFFAFRQRINEIEEEVRTVLGLDKIAIASDQPSIDQKGETVLSREELEQFQQTFEF
jgi:ketol-acid reductoisomerase